MVVMVAYELKSMAPFLIAPHTQIPYQRHLLLAMRMCAREPVDSLLLPHSLQTKMSSNKRERECSLIQLACDPLNCKVDFYSFCFWFLSLSLSLFTSSTPFECHNWAWQKITLLFTRLISITTHHKWKSTREMWLNCQLSTTKMIFVDFWCS